MSKRYFGVSDSIQSSKSLTLQSIGSVYDDENPQIRRRQILGDRELSLISLSSWEKYGIRQRLGLNNIWSHRRFHLEASLPLPACLRFCSNLPAPPPSIKCQPQPGA
ncbi:hypothetical protein GBA52_028550 [Prunus armeniaca]|nr:hypothetical protein GBA52_028550 [Prunus armeniaca]